MKALHTLNGVIASVMFISVLVVAVFLAFVVLNESETTDFAYPESALSVEGYKAYCPFRIGDPDPTIGVTLEFIAGVAYDLRKDNEVIPPPELITYHQLREEVRHKRLQSVLTRYMDNRLDSDEFFEEYVGINREYNEKFNQLEQELLEKYNIDMTKRNGCDASVDSYLDENL